MGAVTVMRVLSFVLHVSMMIECGDREGVVVVIAGHECVGGTGGSGIVSSAGDVLEMSVVCWMRVGGVCEMCLARGSVGCEGVSG